MWWSHVIFSNHMSLKNMAKCMNNHNLMMFFFVIWATLIYFKVCSNFSKAQNIQKGKYIHLLYFKDLHKFCSRSKYQCKINQFYNMKQISITTKESSFEQLEYSESKSFWSITYHFEEIKTITVFDQISTYAPLSAPTLLRPHFKVQA